MSATEFVPADFDVPTVLVGPGFRLIPLLPEHNDADYAAWTSSMEHIRETPGFVGRPWPVAMPKEENRRDLEGHAEDFRLRRGFTYSVRDAAGETIGCVYIYPPDEPSEAGAQGADADVRSWVRADHAHLDGPLYEAVSAWLVADWPFATVAYTVRARS